MSLSLPKMSLSSIDSLKSMTTIHIFIICALETLILNEKMGAGFKPFFKGGASQRLQQSSTTFCSR